MNAATVRRGLAIVALMLAVAAYVAPGAIGPALDLAVVLLCVAALL